MDAMCVEQASTFGDDSLAQTIDFHGEGTRGAQIHAGHRKYWARLILR